MEHTNVHTGLCFGSCRIFCKGPSFKNMVDLTFPVSGRIQDLNLTINIFQIKVTFVSLCTFTVSLL